MSLCIITTAALQCTISSLNKLVFVPMPVNMFDVHVHNIVLYGIRIFEQSMISGHNYNNVLCTWITRILTQSPNDLRNNT